MLTAIEVAFLKRHDLSADDVYDGRKQSKARWRAGVEAAGLTLVLGAACYKEGHRLRTRAGHCVQCDTSKLAYQGRYRSLGYVYVAGSPSEGLLKIGITKDIQKRIVQLRLYDGGYGASSDWEMLFHAKVGNAGEVEGAALRSLEEFKVAKTYKKQGKDQEASELVKVSCDTAIKAVRAAIGSSEQECVWESPRSTDFS